MKWWNGFGRSLLFAALAALACPFYLGFAGLILGWKLAMATYVITVAALYLFGIARHAVLGVAAGGAVVFCGLVLLAVGASGVELALIVAALISVFRTGLLCRERRAGADGFARGFAIEAGLVGAGLALAFHLGHSSVQPEAMAVWGFFMAQSAFFLVGGPEAVAARQSAAPPADLDPFERACRRATALLDETA